jgi:flagellar biosynthesis/type III secretory pathway protein FliH
MQHEKKFLSIITDKEAYTEKFRHSEQKGDAVNMCEMLQSLIDESIAEGHARGLSEGLSRGHLEGLSEGISRGHSEGHSEGLSQGLAACVAALKMTGASFEKTFETITSIDTYKDVAREQIFEFYNQ